MTELEIMQRAKTYIDKLANGIDPLTDKPAAETDCINQIRVSRCLFYVSDILRQVIENDGFVHNSKTAGKASFSISQEELNKYPFEDIPVTVSIITKKINSLVDLTNMKKLKYSSITGFLIKNGFLEEIEVEGNKRIKTPTEQGKTIGIFTEERIGQYGGYIAILYSREAQQFILDHMEAITEINNK